MSIKWETVASTLKLDDQQALIARYLIDLGKDSCLELWEAETDDHGLPPIAYFVELKSKNPGLDNQTAVVRLMEYLSTQRKLGGDSSFLQLQYEREASIKAEMTKLFTADPEATFSQLGIGSLLLDIDTGYSPIDDSFARLTKLGAGTGHATGAATSAPGSEHRARVNGSQADWSPLSDLRLRVGRVTASEGFDWQQLRTGLSLNDQQSMLLRYLLDRLQDDCARLWTTLAADYGLSPLEFIVDLKLQDPVPSYDVIERKLIAYLGATRSFGSGQTFLALQAGLERSLYHQMTRLLDKDQVERFRSLSIGSLLGIATGHTSIVSRLEVLYEENRLKHGIDLFCQMPFEYAHIEDNGKVLPCCPSKFTLHIGNLKKNTMHEIWNSRAAEAVRESIQDRTFRFCNYYRCEYLKKGREKHGD